ncbi:ABC transporter permease [[Clostridium] fimetarium]|uniref:ABC-2 type transport system permease protein n=1 Tax=[Clostridium] fimetarium TaxID=99656 RepID=A0A1I0PYI6_9FIRM|nr:ABC transporter permease [[Clostridium] fimetarium]SEW19615.1 ABC-2 type transport system permease protein [[Clostridium] fimetarium]
MFIHIFKYRIKQLFHVKELVLWTFAFPIVLGTLFYFSFGHLLNTNEFNFKPIPVALVSEGIPNSAFETVIDQFSQENSNQLFTITSASNNEEALQLLKDKKIDGIIYSTGTPTITVSGDGLNQSIIKSFIEQYLQHEYIFKQIAINHPEELTNTINLMSQDISFNKEVSFSNSKMDALSQYFYALIAMTCLYGSITGLNTVMNIQANLSALGARREVSPAHKLIVIFGDFCASVVVNYMSVLLLFFYLIVILKIDFGSKIGLILLTSFAGSVIGVSTGTFLGSVGKWSDKTKESVIMAFTMLCCFLSGLMKNDMKDIIEHTYPIINRLNPAALITDCLYSLNMYDTYDRFISDIAIIGIMALLLCFGSFFLLRRNKYASI